MGTRKFPMKNKWIAAAAALALSASLIPGAMAAEMKEYTLEEADRLTDLYRYDGYQADNPGTDFTMWYRDTMLDVEITEEGQSQGYLMASIGPECMLSVKLLDENISLEDYTKRVQEGVSPSAEIQKVNDVDFAIYDEPENEGVFCRVAAALTASLAVSASAASVGHAHDECAVWNNFVNNNLGGNNVGAAGLGYTNSVFSYKTDGWRFEFKFDAKGRPVAGEVYNMAELAQTAATVSSYTKVKLPKGVRSTYTACKEAITVKEMDAICEATEGLNNLTVFKQRNISNVTAGETATFKLWTVGKRNSAVVLFRAEGATEWTILAQGEAGQKEVADVALPGNGAYAVCMAW